MSDIVSNWLKRILLLDEFGFGIQVSYFKYNSKIKLILVISVSGVEKTSLRQLLHSSDKFCILGVEVSCKKNLKRDRLCEGRHKMNLENHINHMKNGKLATTFKDNATCIIE